MKVNLEFTKFPHLCYWSFKPNRVQINKTLNSVQFRPNSLEKLILNLQSFLICAIDHLNLIEFKLTNHPIPLNFDRKLMKVDLEFTKFPHLCYWSLKPNWVQISKSSNSTQFRTKTYESWSWIYKVSSSLLLIT